MFDTPIIFAASLFGFVAVLVFWAARLFTRSSDTRVRQRLSSSGGAAAPSRLDAEAARRRETLRFKDLFTRLGQAAAKPFMSENREKQSELRRKLGMAGIYSPSSIRVVTGFKVILLAVGIFGGYLVGAVNDAAMMGLSLGGIFGYLAPLLWLKAQIRKQQRALEHGLPDALDLMVVCVEAGLAVDAAMERVGQELSMVHPRLGRELEIAHLETRVGLSRTESLKNLGTRTGCSAIQSLVSMLIQADRFGTSIAGALRMHAEGLRVMRQQRAEEMAAKASVKMSFPLVLFIFPATFIVLAGPTIVELLNSSLMN
jgi:tight adherence protein C